MRNNTNEQGVAHVGLIIVVVLVLALVAFAFWRVQDQPDEQQAEPTTSEVEESDAIEDAEGLEAAETELQQADIDGELDVEELDATLQ